MLSHFQVVDTVHCLILGERSLPAVTELVDEVDRGLRLFQVQMWVSSRFADQVVPERIDQTSVVGISWNEF